MIVQLCGVEGLGFWIFIRVFMCLKTYFFLLKLCVFFNSCLDDKLFYIILRIFGILLYDKIIYIFFKLQDKENKDKQCILLGDLDNIKGIQLQSFLEVLECYFQFDYLLGFVIYI